MIIGTMLSTNLNIGSATAAVVAAFHGAANIMREIQERHQNQNRAAELLARGALMRDALQTAAEQVARAYTIGNETVGPWFGVDDGNSSYHSTLLSRLNPV